MHRIWPLGLAGFLIGCASAGAFPTVAGDPNASMTAAQRQIGLAHDAGADSLAPDVLALAQRQFQAAQTDLDAHRVARASVSAQQAAATAAYAKAQADRVRAEREKAQADSAMQALPQQGRRQ